MNTRISDRLRVALGKKYLDWVEKRPEVGGSGTIAMLQRIRKHQRQESEASYTRSRPLENCEIEVLWFRLIEVFHIEECDQLLQRLPRLFPELEGGPLFGREGFQDAFKYQAGRISGGAYWRLGRIVRDTGKWLLPRPVRDMRKLPVEVDYVEVWLRKILPSMFIVTLDVHLTDEATQQLVRLQDKHYLSEIRFEKLIPRGPTGDGYSWIGSKAIMQRTILHWLKRLRGEVETCIRPFVSGYFAQWSSDKTARLPAIEVYALKGVTKGESVGEWVRSARGWWESFGFALYGYDTYSDGKVLFLPKDKLLGTSDEVTHRLLVLWEEYIQSIDTKGHGNDKRAVARHTEDTLTALLPCIAVQEVLHCLQRDLEQKRQKLFGAMKPSRFSSVRLGKHLKLNDVVLQTSMLLDRISAEFEQEKAWFRHDMRELAELKTVKGFGDTEPRALTDALFDSIDFRVQLLDKHVSFAKDWLSQYVTLRNTAATYLLAVVVGIATIISAVLAWLELRQ